MGARNNQIDALKGIGMIFVIVGHMNYSQLGSSVWSYLYSFHMPLFFIVTGFLAKESPPRFYVFLIRKIKTLLLPYTVFFAVSLLFGYLFKPLVLDKAENLPSLDIIQVLKAFLFSGGELNSILLYNFPLWFLPLMFIAEICFYVMRMVKFEWLFLCIIISLVISTVFIQSEITGRPYFHINVLPAALVFMGIGYLYKKYFKETSANSIVVIILLVISIILIYTNMGAHIAKIQNPINYFIAATMTTYIYFQAVKSCSAHSFLSYFGRNSLIVYGLHSLVIKTYYYTPIPEYFGRLNGVASFSVGLVFVVLINLALIKIYSTLKSTKYILRNR